MSSLPGRVMRASACASTFVAVVVATGTAHAAYTIGDEEKFLKIGGLLQFHAGTTQDAAPNGSSWETELYLRRIRLIAFGQLDKTFNFFVETDNPRYGYRGDFTGNTFIQDAFAEVNLDPAIQIDAGMMLVPFSHQGIQSAGSLLPIDYHPLLLYPAGTNRVWRDFGVQARGLLLDTHLEYRVGVFNGARGSALVPVLDPVTNAVTNGDALRNPKDLPRFTARLVGNVWDAEGGPGAGGFFADGIYLEEKPEGLVSPKRVLSLGVSGDFQPDLVVNTNAAGTAVTSRSAYYALSGDVFADIPVNPEATMSATGQVNAYYYALGDRGQNTVVSSGVSGIGLSAEAGFRYERIEPLVLVDWFNPTKNATGNETGKLLGLYGGVNYWVNAHTFNVKAQFGAAKAGAATGDGAWKMAALAQLQLSF